MEIKININAPGLETAIQDLAQALREGGIYQTRPQPKAEETQKDQVEHKEESTKPETQSDSAPSISLETVRTKLAELSQAGKQPQVKSLITSFGVERLSDIPAEHYEELLEKASEL